MKTIEERIQEYVANAWVELDQFNEDHVTFENIVTSACIVGANFERDELTRWRDPKKELPELLTPVLGKQSDAKKTYYKVVYRREYDDDNGYYWTDNGCRSLYIDGWRPIYENKQDALCIFTSQEYP